MKKEKKKQNVKKGWIFWTPRIIAVAFTLFLMLFSLDVFGNDYGFWGTALAFLMHNIPVFVLAAAILISWRKHGWLAGSIFILAGLLYIALVTRTAILNGFEWYYLIWAIQLAGPAIFIGVLFFIDWKRRR